MIRSLVEVLHSAASSDIPVEIWQLGRFEIRGCRGRTIPNPQPKCDGYIYAEPYCRPHFFPATALKAAAKKYPAEIKIQEQIADGTTPP